MLNNKRNIINRRKGKGQVRFFLQILPWLGFVDSTTLTIVVVSVTLFVRECTAGDDIVRILPGVFLFVVDKSQSSHSASSSLSIGSASIVELLFIATRWWDGVVGGLKVK